MKYTVTKASDILKLKPYLLRFYESEFELDIPREKNNRRYYTKKELDLFREIERLKNKGMKNSEIKKVINEKGNNEEKIEKIEFSDKASEDNFDYLIDLVKSLQSEITELKKSNTFKQRDELLSENARLRMKVKEKSYELSIIKERYNTLEKQKKRSIFHFE